MENENNERKEEEQEKYLSASQDGIVRLDLKKTSSKYIGLHTTGLETCWAIIIYNQSTKRASLIHTTMQGDPSDVAQELKWVGLDSQINWVIVSNEDLRNRVLDKKEDYPRFMREMASTGLTYPEPTRMTVSHGTDSVYINRENISDVKISSSLSKVLPIELSPNTDTRYDINLINNWFLESPNHRVKLDLQFNGYTWTQLPKISYPLDSLKEIDCQNFLKLGQPRAALYLAEQLKIQGNEYFKNSDFKQACACYTRATWVYPEYAAAYLNLGSAYYRLGNIDQATKAWNDCLTINPNYKKARDRLDKLQHSADKKNKNLLAQNMQRLFKPKRPNRERQESGKSSSSKPNPSACHPKN